MAKEKVDRKTKRLQKMQEKEEKKLLRKKRIQKEAKRYKKEKEIVPKKTNFFLLRLELRGALFITNLDHFIDTFANAEVIGRKVTDVAARFIMHLDYAIDVVNWFVVRYFVFLLRKIHNVRVYLNNMRKKLIKNAIIVGVIGISLTVAYGSVIDYEYSYNGQVLGIVNDQNEVVDILDLVSEGLSEEYDALVTIEAGRDISFKPVVSINKDIDKADDVLRKLSYLGEIRVAAYGIYADDQLVIALDTEEHANDVLNGLINLYVNDKDKYESIEFREKIEVKEVQLTLNKITNVQSAIEFIQTSNLVKTTHTIEYGDTVENICNTYMISKDKFYELNPEIAQGGVLKVGENVMIETVKPYVTLSTVRIAVLPEAIPFETTFTDSPSYYLDTYVVTQDGQDGKKSITARLKEVNGEIVEKEVLSTEVLFEPVPRIITHGTKPIPPREGTGTFILPVHGYHVGSTFGGRADPITGEWSYHNGVDLQVPYGTPVHASDGGIVAFAGWDDSYGYHVIIDHGSLFRTLYAHNDELLVSTGDKIYQDQIIAYAGSTGYSTGSHCHFEIQYDGSAVDPENYVDIW